MPSGWFGSDLGLGWVVRILIRRRKEADVEAGKRRESN